MESNYYEVLGVKSSAKDEDIKHAFKSLAKVYHPDKNPGNKSYEEEFKKINEAYQVLSDNSKRFFYDIKLESRRSAHAAEAAPTPPPAYAYSTRKRPKEKNEKEASVERKVWLFVAAGAILFISAAFLLYNFMNSYAASGLYEEGYELEKNKVYIGAMEKYSEAIGYDKTFASAYTRRAILRMRCLGDFNAGLYDLNQAISYTKKPESILYYYRGNVQKRLGKNKEAMNDFNQAIATNPKFDSAYFAKAEIERTSEKNYSLAILHYSKAVEINSKFTKAYLGKALAEQEVKRYKDALSDLDKAIELEDDVASFYHFRAITKIAMKKKKQACDDFDLAVAKGYEPAKQLRKKYCR